MVSDPDSGRVSRHLLSHFETISYAELWARVRALAGFWQHDEARPLRADDRLCIIAFAGCDFVTADLAAIHNGSVVIPMQTNAPLAQLTGIVTEIEPRWIATSLECLDTTVELVLIGYRPAGLLLLDYHPEVDDERDVFTAAQRSWPPQDCQTFW